MFACNNGSFPLLLRLLNYTKMIHRQIDPRHTPISIKYNRNDMTCNLFLLQTLYSKIPFRCHNS